MKGTVVEGRLHVGEWAGKSHKWLPVLYSKGWSFVLFRVSKKRVHYGEQLIQLGSTYHLLVSNFVIPVMMEDMETWHSLL